MSKVLSQDIFSPQDHANNVLVFTYFIVIALKSVSIGETIWYTQKMYGLCASKRLFDTSYRLHKTYGAAIFYLRSPLTYGLKKNQQKIVKYPLLFLIFVCIWLISILNQTNKESKEANFLVRMSVDGLQNTKTECIAK